MDMGKAALAALACLAFLDAVSAVTLDKVTANEVSFSYQDVENRGGMVCAPLSHKLGWPGMLWGAAFVGVEVNESDRAK